MSPLFSVVMTAFEPFHLLPRALMCLCRQEYAGWELLLMVDGAAPAGRFHPRRVVEQLKARFPANRLQSWELPRAEGFHGNVGRNLALRHARGDYVCWFNHDNLITPQYLSAHVENIRKRPGCLSVVDVDLWVGGRYHGVYPRALARSRIDLLCFAVPLETARRVDAFGGEMSRIYAADWLVFDACRKLLPVRHNRRVVGTHF